MKILDRIERLVGFLDELPNRFRDLEISLAHLTGDVMGLHERMKASKKEEKTTILVLPPDNNEVLTRQVSLFDHDLSMSFAPQRSLPKGCWIVLLGPGTVKSVTVGNQYQSSGYPADGPLWKTIDDCEIGVYLTVVVGR